MDTHPAVAALLTTPSRTRYAPALHGDFRSGGPHLVDGVTKFDKEFYGKGREARRPQDDVAAAKNSGC